jgi:hypothetical protein
MNRAEMYGRMIEAPASYNDDAVLIIRIKLTPPDDDGVRLVDWDAAALMPTHYPEALLISTVRAWLERAEEDKDAAG